MRLVGVERMHGILTDELNKPPKGVSVICSADLIGNRCFEVQRVLLYIYLQGIGVEKMHGILMDELNKPPKGYSASFSAPVLRKGCRESAGKLQWTHGRLGTPRKPTHLYSSSSIVIKVWRDGGDAEC